MPSANKIIILAAFATALSLTCAPVLKYTPDPKKDVGGWAKNFDRQRSFVYEYRMRTRTADVSGRGTCVIGWGEHIKGRWQSAAGSFEFEYYGIDDVEYSRKDGSWTESARGEESNVFVQIQRMLNFDKFEYLEKESDYTYRFKANVPFLAPDKWKEMIGTMRISPRNFLPDFVWAGLPDSSVFWEARLKDYNRAAAIEAPVEKWNDYQLAADGSVDQAGFLAAVQRRLRLIGAPFRLRTAGRGLILSMPAGYKIPSIGDLCAPGRVAVNWLTSEKTQAKKIGYLMDDLKQPLLMTGEILDPKSIKDCRLLIDRVSRPHLQLILKNRLSRTGSLCLEVDSVIVAQTTIDKGQNLGTIRFDVNMGYYQMNIIRAAILQPLPRLTVTAAPGE